MLALNVTRKQPLTHHAKTNGRLWPTLTTRLTATTTTDDTYIPSLKSNTHNVSMHNEFRLPQLDRRERERGGGRQRGENYGKGGREASENLQSTNHRCQ